MYLVGLANWWVFEAPFHTIPIDTDGVDDPEVRTKPSAEEQLGSLEFITFHRI
jgi:hypothetical protein